MDKPTDKHADVVKNPPRLSRGAEPLTHEQKSQQQRFKCIAKRNQLNQDLS